MTSPTTSNGAQASSNPNNRGGAVGKDGLATGSMSSAPGEAVGRVVNTRLNARHLMGAGGGGGGGGEESVHGQGAGQDGGSGLGFSPSEVHQQVREQASNLIRSRAGLGVQTLRIS